MTWEVLNIVGTVAFAASGAIIAMEEDYDLLGVYMLGFVTAFGGGIIRNLLIGIPVTEIWDQERLFTIALVSVAAVFLSPLLWIRRWKRWGHFFDAVGLSAFATQGALYAVDMGHPLSAVIVAAVMTGTGGGIIRDVLAGRKPLVFREEIYVLWAVMAGLVVGSGWVREGWQLYGVVIGVVLLRMLSIHYRWKLPSRSLSRMDLGH